MADFCMDPYTWMKNISVEKKYLNEETFSYYATCDQEAAKQYESQFDDCIETINELEQTLTEFDATSGKEKVTIVYLFSHFRFKGVDF